MPDCLYNGYAVCVYSISQTMKAFCRVSHCIKMMGRWPLARLIQSGFDSTPSALR